MEGERAQEFLLDGVVLHELRRQFHEIPPYVCSREALESSVGEHTMERVSEFMQEGLHFAQCEQSRLFLGRLRQIHHHAHVGSHVHSLPVYPLSLVFRHPGSSLLSLSGVEVGIEHGEVFPVVVKHLICLHIGVVHWYLLVLLERDAIQSVCQSEHSVNHLVQFQIRTQHLRVEVEALQLQFVGVEAEVPRLHPEVFAFHFLRLLLYVRHLFLCRRHIGVDEVIEQLVHVVCIARHTVFQHVVGVCPESQKLCDFPSQIHYTFAYFDVVLRVVMGAYLVALHIHLLPEAAPCGIGHERAVAREIQCEHPSLHSVFLGSSGSSLARRFGQSVEVLLVGDVQLERLVLLEQVLRELQREHARLFGQPAQLLLVLVVEQRSAPHESVVAVVEQPLFLGCQSPVVVVYGLDSLEEFLVEPHVVGVFRQDWLYLLRQGIHLVIRLRAEQIEEYGGDPRQQVVISVLVVVHVDYRVVKSRFIGIVYGLLYLFVVSSDAFEKRLFVVFESYLVKWHGLVWRGIRHEKRVLASFLFCIFLFHTNYNIFICKVSVFLHNILYNRYTFNLFKPKSV